MTDELGKLEGDATQALADTKAEIGKLGAQEVEYHFGDAFGGLVQHFVGFGRAIAANYLNWLADFEPVPEPVQLVFSGGGMMRPGVRAFVDFAATYLARLGVVQG